MKTFDQVVLTKKRFDFSIFFLSDSFILLQQITSTSDVELKNPRISWLECVRCSFWSGCFCNLISFSSLTFSSLSILYGRISSVPVLYFPTMLGVSGNFNRVFNFWFWLLIQLITTFLLLNIMTPDTAISERVGFCVCFWSYYAKSLSDIMFVGQFCKSGLVSLLGTKCFPPANRSSTKIFHGESGTTNQF